MNVIAVMALVFSLNQPRSSGVRPTILPAFALLRLRLEIDARFVTATG
jgi:hypothetical protein